MRDMNGHQPKPSMTLPEITAQQGVLLRQLFLHMKAQAPGIPLTRLEEAANQLALSIQEIELHRADLSVRGMKAYLADLGYVAPGRPGR